MGLEVHMIQVTQADYVGGVLPGIELGYIVFPSQK
jgi:hypothetical protein